MRSPLNFIWRNVVFATSADDAWAVYRVQMQSYAGLPASRKIEALGTFAAFASAIEADFQLMRVQRAWYPEDYLAAAASTADRGHADGEMLDALLASHEAAISSRAGRPS